METLNQDEHYIKRCIELANMAGGAGEFPFGAVVVLNDVIISVPTPQTAYYSERIILNPRRWTEWDSYEIPQDVMFNKIRENSEIKYLLVSFSEPNHPSWMKVQTGNTWEIPFMDTKIDFGTQIQDVKQEKTFDDLKFTLVDVKQDIFIYYIERI